MLGRLLRGLRGRDNREVVPAPVPAPTPAAASTPSLPGLPFMIRPLESRDLASLGQVFSGAIDGLASRDYDETQRQAWKSRAADSDFLDSLQQGVTIIAENHDAPVAFAQLHPATHLRMLYVDPEWAGLGIATLLYQYLEDEARILGSDHLDTDASQTARRFFESVGFRAGDEQSVRIGDVEIARIPMHKKL